MSDYVECECCGARIHYDIELDVIGSSIDARLAVGKTIDPIRVHHVAEVELAAQDDAYRLYRAGLRAAQAKLDPYRASERVLKNLNLLWRKDPYGRKLRGAK